MTSKEIRQKFLKFFEGKECLIIPSSSVVPENDSTTLFTGSGMQPLVPFLMGEKHPQGKKLVNSQKCFRAQDIEEVGDNRHTTFFEMLGNWSLGDFFKAEQIPWMFEFLTNRELGIGLDAKNIYVTVFRGSEDLGISRDNEAVELWQKCFKEKEIEAKAVDFSEKDGIQDGRIFYYGEKKNWWSRSGVPANMPVGEIGGPDTEMFWDFGADLKMHENSQFKDEPCHVNCDCGRFVEIGNNVFIQYVKTEKGFEQLPAKNVDFGGGLSRMVAASINNPDIFKTDLFVPIVSEIEKLTSIKYDQQPANFRIIADHLNASVFLIADGVLPSNTDRGYVLRRLIRRAVRYGKLLGIESNFITTVSEAVIGIYKNVYPEVEKNKEKIFGELKNEEEKFRKTLDDGLRELNKIIKKKNNNNEAVRITESFGSKSGDYVNAISGKDAFILFSTYGFPLEMIQEELAKFLMFAHEEEFKQEFQEEFKKHQELSKTASAGMFKGGLADAGEITTKYHTATHLLLAAMREILGKETYQKGSNITAERLRFDFNYPQKLTDEQIKKVEDLVNQKIQESLTVEMLEMPKEDALKIAKVSFDSAKYGDVVKVYFIGGSLSEPEKSFSVELCGGPHVKNTEELGKFKITKEEAVSAGVRRIKAVLG